VAVKNGVQLSASMQVAGGLSDLATKVASSSDAR